MSENPFREVVAEIERTFPDEKDWRRYECYAWLFQRLAYRHTERAEYLKAREKATPDGGR